MQSIQSGAPSFAVAASCNGFGDSRAGPWARLQALRNLPMEAPAARPVAMVLGAVLGGSTALVMGALAPLPAAVLGALLGETSLLLSRADHWEQQQYPRWVRLLQAYPGLREVASRSGVDLTDRDRVRRVYEGLQQQMQSMVETYRTHCIAHGLPRSDVVDNVLKAFYLSFCVDAPPCIIMCPQKGWRYFAAVDRAALPAIKHDINVRGLRPDQALRHSGCPFMRVDVLGQQLRGAAGFRIARRQQEWQVSPTLVPDAEPLLDCYRPTTTAVVQVQQHRVSVRRRATPDAPAARPGPVDPPFTRAVEVRWGVRLRDQLMHLPPDSVTRRALADLQQDLRQGRQPGHRITLSGQAWLASDARIEGLKGRNLWRVLYCRTGDAYTLEGIGNYHGLSTVQWWNG
ncbi:hypothetical protein [Stenotrophomonas sp. SORGH_AS_0321]|uniref:hypothetical protein n=1 Tax=Stenotrophomonas sp. SORGH_AS_0321 TaxID=3041787 RepID=UPI00285EF50C|nr:hypothetical protein [Stenotrophomonas sp. SORGH_AS_0321]MDR6092772.1 hypothetical protein [Stenotrophomonas sp. SORGH_AS_0321]